MKLIKTLFQHPGSHRLLCAGLAAAILIGLFPSLRLREASPSDPLEEQEITDIQLLHPGVETQGDQTDPNQRSEEGLSPERDPDPAETTVTEPTESQREETQTEETQTEETQTEETQTEETQTEETQTEETQTEESPTEETQSEAPTTAPTPPTETAPTENGLSESESPDPTTGDGDQGQEDGNQGEEGGSEGELRLGAVLTWFKYGTHAKTIVCNPSSTVYKFLNTAQLDNNRLKYAFSLTGEDAEKVTIQEVSVKSGEGDFRTAETEGTLLIHLPEEGEREDTFLVRALMDQEDGTKEAIFFTFLLKWGYAPDLELELSWNKDPEGNGTAACPSNGTVAKTIESHELPDNVLSYSPRLTGALADKGQIIACDYTTASGESGTLDAEGGALVLRCPEGSKEETYVICFTATCLDEDNRQITVFYQFHFLFRQTDDVSLSFTWLERGLIPRELLCRRETPVTEIIKNNQLSGGVISYEIQLKGDDSANARILSISYTSESASGGKLTAQGTLPMTIPQGAVSNTYSIFAKVLVKGKQLSFEIRLRYVMDVSLRMSYEVIENGVVTGRTIQCENGTTKISEAIYDDQLQDSTLAYSFHPVGEESVTITSVTCYQSGSGKVVTLGPTGELKLLLKNEKTGENTFTVKAQDEEGGTYTFKFSLPYKHRGQNSVQITTNLTNGQVLINETSINLRVSACTVDENGNVISYIPPTGTDTKLRVELDGETIGYASSSGHSSEYILHPQNPEIGDENTHILYIYAEDAYGNFGELTLELKGQRNQAGQKTGTATIYIDLSVLGLGIVDSVQYDVLANEPISYSVAKAVLGKELEEPFGLCENTLGWSGIYTGTLDHSFYLQRLSPGISGNALMGGTWSQYGKNEQEVFTAIDNYFGKGTGLATLWRCIYRNGLNKSEGYDGSYGEFDFTSGSGWLFSLDGTYYPGLSMSEFTLKDGDVLTLRYTLAYGWDVGGGTEGYGNALGYCVTAMNGSFAIHHQIETIEQEDGSLQYECHYCGLIEDCPHDHIVYKDLEDDTHVKYCQDCRTTVGDPEPHSWIGDNTVHVCGDCNLSVAHNAQEIKDSNTATCTGAGERTMFCTECEMTWKEASPPLGHALNNRWNHTKTEHYQKCSRCRETIPESRGYHDYEYDAFDEDWYCRICDAGHDWGYCGNDHLVLQSATCREIVYHCHDCGLDFLLTGEFPEYHSYAEGQCIHCGQEAPAPPEESTAPEEPPTESTEPASPPTESAPPEEPPAESAPPEEPPTEPQPPTDPQLWDPGKSSIP